jgi:L-alanine-DL-glutamate epimerase-like enolase superfamily enzyme
MIANAAPLDKGYLALPTEAGLGWVLDREYIAKYRINQRTSQR